MRAYAAILRGRLAVLFQYRAAALAGLATQVFWGIVKIMILTAFYAQSASGLPLSLAQAITFVWLGQALLQLLPWNMDREIEAQVKNGNVAYDLVPAARPLLVLVFQIPGNAAGAHLAAQHSAIFIGGTLLWTRCPHLVAGSNRVYSVAGMCRLVIFRHHDMGDHQSFLNPIRGRVAAPFTTCGVDPCRHGCAAASVSRLAAAFFEFAAVSGDHRYSL